MWLRIDIELVPGHTLPVRELPSPDVSAVQVVTTKAAASTAVRHAIIHVHGLPTIRPCSPLAIKLSLGHAGRVFTNVNPLENEAKMGFVLLGSANGASTECTLHAGHNASRCRYVGARGKILFASPVREFSRPGS